MFVHNKDIELEQCEPGVTRKILSYDETLMMVEVSFEAGAEGYVHSHPHLQITYVALGSFEFTIDGKTEVVVKGDSVYIPSDAKHGVKALEEGMLIDVFNPYRAEFLNKE
jgi:quercetin dioxygenase-like cupin family protein